MTYVSSLRRVSRAKRLATLLLMGILGWAVGIPGFMNIAYAGSLTFVSDTITNSAPSGTSNHSIVFNSNAAITAGQTFRVTFDPDTNGFSGLPSIVLADLTTSSNFTPVGACGAGASEATFTTSNNPDYIEFTACAGDTIASGTTTINIVNNKITNPGAEGSYVVRIGGTMANQADTRVAIVNAVAMTASVDTTLTFTISGVASSTTINSDPVQTSTTTTAILIPFGTLQPGVAKMAAQHLNVTTNARNGFVVTIIQNQNLTSNTGADIDLFKDGAANVTPIAWVAPSNTLGNENTYGHYGVTSEDADLNGGEFTGDKFAGNFGTTTRVIFSNNGPADGLAANIGSTTIGFKIQIGSLQEAANDYTNQITYVCTPTF